LAGSTALYDIVGSPVGCIPVTLVDPSKDGAIKDWFEGPGHSSKLFEQQIFEGKSPVYDARKMANISVGVQIVGRRWEDEKVDACC